MSAWTRTAVNGALADSLVTNFGGGNAQTANLGADARMCLTLTYSADAATQVRIFLAPTSASPAEEQVLIYDSALQLNPAADTTDYLTNISVDVPIQSSGRPLELRITKAASDAFIWWVTTPQAGAGC